LVEVKVDIGVDVETDTGISHLTVDVALRILI